MGHQLTIKGSIQIAAITMSCFGLALTAYGAYVLVQAILIRTPLLILFATILVAVGILPIINTYNLFKNYNAKTLREFLLVTSVAIYLISSELTQIHTGQSYGYALLVAFIYYYLTKKHLLPYLLKRSIGNA